MGFEQHQYRPIGADVSTSKERSVRRTVAQVFRFFRQNQLCVLLVNEVGMLTGVKKYRMCKVL